jgi:ABC-2 type transport system permease protein
MSASRTRTEWVGFTTIVIREFNRIVRIWGQTIVPPTVTATLYSDERAARRHRPI